MATDYVIFIHGVNNRVRADFEKQARYTFTQIQDDIKLSPPRILKPVFLFWGDIAAESIEVLFQGLNNSPTWEQFWFREFRSTQVINFVGDAALYLSRNVSVKIIQQMFDQALQQMELSFEDLKQPQAGDRLHLVTHSWGTVILFDFLFADRWESLELSPEIRDFVDNLRSIFFGVGKPEIKKFGMPIASIHTMGSPISLFNLLNASGAQSFNLTPNLRLFLSSLHEKTGKALPWRNYAHPGDPIAYPLTGVMDLSLKESKNQVQIEDIISPTNFFERIFSQNIISLIQGGKAHGSYWTEPSVIQTIRKVIETS